MKRFQQFSLGKKIERGMAFETWQRKSQLNFLNYFWLLKLDSYHISGL